MNHPTVATHTLFSSGLEMADLVVSSGLLDHSMEAISALHNDLKSSYDAGVADELIESSTTEFSVRCKFYNQSQVPSKKYTVIAFVSSSSDPRERKNLSPSPLLEQNSSLFEFMSTKDNPSFSINQEAITHFMSLFDQLSRRLPELESSKIPIIITGHSLGGSVACLFTLWLLKNIPSSATNLPFCITYGSPLIGDYGFQQAISDRQTWNHRFLHVVSNLDDIPRLFITAHNSLPNVNSSQQASSYEPFGTFLMCSLSGCACFEDPETVLELMAAMESEIDRTRDSSERLHLGVTDYVKVLEHLKGKINYKEVSDSRGLSTSLRVELVLQLEAIGLKKSEQQNSKYDDLICTMENREKANFSSRRQISDPAKKLNEIKINMAYMEWYKKVTKTMGIGYYDAYKSRHNPRDMDVVKYKNFLTNYWEDEVNKVERNLQKEGVPLRSRWVFAGTNYRRMVEPLDIADYYKRPGNKDYQTKGRKYHYIVLQKLQEEADKAAMDQNKVNTKNTASSLTEDSCFWAHVEDALIFCKSLKNGEEASKATEEETRRKLMEFESYVMDLINKFEVSPEIFLEKSSFMQWWNEYKSILDHEYKSPLTDFMKNENYIQYA